MDDDQRVFWLGLDAFQHLLDEPLQPIAWRGVADQRLLGDLPRALNGTLDQRHEGRLLARKVAVHEPMAHLCSGGDVGDLGGLQATPSKYSERSAQDHVAPFIAYLRKLDRRARRHAPTYFRRSSPAPAPSGDSGAPVVAESIEFTGSPSCREPSV